jgi:hypothetical protein
MSAIVVISATLRCQAGFFCEVNGITFPYSSLGIHFVAFFLNLPGTKNSMTFAIDHPAFKNRTRAKKFSLLTNLYRCFQADSAKDTGLRLTTYHVTFQAAQNTEIDAPAEKGAKRHQRDTIA